MNELDQYLFLLDRVKNIYDHVETLQKAVRQLQIKYIQDRTTYYNKLKRIENALKITTEPKCN